MKKIKLYCLAYAGASAYVFYELRNKLSDEIEVVLVDLPGKGQRANEQFCKTMNEAVQEVADCITGSSHDMEYAVLGYSMGGLVAYETLYELHKRGSRMPKCVFLAAAAPPEKMRDEDRIYKLPDSAFIDKIVQMGGVDRECFEEKEYREFCLPILRADFKMLGEYEYLPREYRPDVSSYILFSDEEKEGIEEWNRYFEQDCCYLHFDKGHFFINDQVDKMVKIIQKFIGKRGKNEK